MGRGSSIEMRGLQTGIGLIKLVEDWIMSVNGSAIQEALSNPVSEYHMKPSVPVVHNALSSDMVTFVLKRHCRTVSVVTINLRETLIELALLR